MFDRYAGYLQKLKVYGVCGQILIQFFLINHVIRLNGDASRSFHINECDSQGSIFGHTYSYI